MKTIMIIQLFVAALFTCCCGDGDNTTRKTVENTNYLKPEKVSRSYPFRLTSYGDFRAAYMKAHRKKDEDC